MNGTKKNVLIVIVAVFFVAVLSLSACASGSGASSGGSSATAAGWSLDSDCLTCHTAAVNSGSEAASLLATHGSNDCASCHADDDGTLTVAHADATTASSSTELVMTKVSNDRCLSCHKLETVSKETENWGDDEGVNPHYSMHGVAVTCTDCHTAHNKSTLACNKCHGWDLPKGWLQPPTY